MTWIHPFKKYLPWFTLENKDASARITVRHLLNQTSGISTRDGNRFWAYQQTLEEAVRGLDDIVLVHPVGTTFEYSNFNYIIAGLIVEVVSGQSYAAYVTENIFEPLDMRHSFASLEPALAHGLSDGHIMMFGYVFRDMRFRSPAALPTGFLMASVEDMTHFAMAQVNGGQYEETSILSPQGIAQMHASTVSQGNGGYWGIGWDVSEYDGMTAVARVGDTGNFHAVMILLPEKEMAVVLLANASSFEHLSARVVDVTGIGVFEMLNGKTAAPVSVPFQIQFLYWLLLLTPFLQILVNIFIWRRRRTKILGMLLTVVFNLVIAFTILNLAQQQMPIRSLLVYNPELGCASIITVVTGFGWSAIYTVILLMRRRPNYDFF